MQDIAKACSETPLVSAADASSEPGIEDDWSDEEEGSGSAGVLRPVGDVLYDVGQAPEATYDMASSVQETVSEAALYDLASPSSPKPAPVVYDQATASQVMYIWPLLPTHCCIATEPKQGRQ